MKYKFRVCKHYFRIERYEIERETAHRIFTKYHGQFNYETDSFCWFSTFDEAVAFAEACAQKRLNQLKGQIIRINTALESAKKGECHDADYLRRDMPKNVPIMID